MVGGESVAQENLGDGAGEVVFGQEKNRMRMVLFMSSLIGAHFVFVDRLNLPKRLYESC
jgi:hypothetical protein